MNTETHQGTLQPSERSPFPTALSYAGSVWIVFGAITLIGVLTLLSIVAFSAVPFAVLLGLAGFFMGRHPAARKRAAAMAVVATVWPVGLIAGFLSM